MLKLRYRQTLLIKTPPHFESAVLDGTGRNIYIFFNRWHHHSAVMKCNQSLSAAREGNQWPWRCSLCWDSPVILSRTYQGIWPESQPPTIRVSSLLFFSSSLFTCWKEKVFIALSHIKIVQLLIKAFSSHCLFIICTWSRASSSADF